MAAWARWINMGILFTNGKLPSIHSESVPRSRAKAVTYRYAEKAVEHFEPYGIFVPLLLF